MKTVDLVNFRISGSWSRFLTLKHPARSQPPKSITSYFLLSKEKKVCVCDHRYDRLSPVACCRRITLPCLALSLVYISFFRRPRKTGTRQPRACGYRLLAYAYTYYALCYDPSPPPRMFARCKRDRAYYSECSFLPIGRFAWIRI